MKPILRIFAVVLALLLSVGSFTALASSAPDDYDEWADGAIGVRGLIGYDDYPKKQTAELGDSSVDTYVLCGVSVLAIAGAVVAHKKRKSIA